MSLTIELQEGPITIDANKLALYTDKFYAQSPPSRKVFDKFIVFADHYTSLDNKTKKIYDDLGTLRGAKLKLAQSNVLAWYNSLVSDLVDVKDILEFVKLAENCGNETMYTLAVFALSDDLERTKTIDAIRERYSIQNDLTEADQDQLAKEDEIWNKIKDE
jgi:hypothetical protein